jgi:hypothetical protein
MIKRRQSWGENHNKAKITAKQVVEIKNKYSLLGNNIENLAKEYAVSIQTIKRILDGTTWKFVGEFPERFYLLRTEDVSGISGEGIVAFGVRFLDGSCVLQWNGGINSIELFDNLEDLESIHGHGEKTLVIFID